MVSDKNSVQVLVHNFLFTKFYFFMYFFESFYTLFDEYFGKSPSSTALIVY